MQCTECCWYIKCKHVEEYVQSLPTCSLLNRSDYECKLKHCLMQLTVHHSFTGIHSQVYFRTKSSHQIVHYQFPPDEGGVAAVTLAECYIDASLPQLVDLKEVLC